MVVMEVQEGSKMKYVCRVCQKVDIENKREVISSPCYLEVEEDDTEPDSCPFCNCECYADALWESVTEFETKHVVKHVTDDAVNRPSHYCEGRKYEPADVAEDWGLDKDAYLFNVFTYIARAGRKDDIVQDLEKARWYLDRRIKCLKESRE